MSVLVSRRLSRPIKTIEQKLKAIKLGKRNEKIEYNHNSENDEMGCDNQYNLMVDELSESASRCWHNRNVNLLGARWLVR